MRTNRNATPVTLPAGPPRVLMLVGNTFVNDTRVLKSALAVADGGAQVTVLGISYDALPAHSWLGPVRLVRAPIRWVCRDATLQKSKRESSPPVRNDVEWEALRAESRLWIAEAEELGGLRRWTRAANYKLRVQQGKLRRRVQHRVEELSNQASSIRSTRDDQRRHLDWRHIVSEMNDYAFSFDPIIDDLEWDVIHAHDVHMMGVASRAVARRKKRGLKACWIYDAHELVSGLSVYPPRTQRRVNAFYAMEREYLRHASGIITVSDPLADVLTQQYGLHMRPTVVMNTPDAGALTVSATTEVRSTLGLADEVPLIVYSGGVTSARGLKTVVEALPLLPKAHFAVVCVPHKRSAPARELEELAKHLGVDTRFHLLDPVPPDQVSSFLRTADLGVIPILKCGSHDVALPNKLFEYGFAGLRVLVSDLPAQTDFVANHSLGLSHKAGDPDSFACGARKLLSREDYPPVEDGPLKSNLTPYVWERQAERLRQFYADQLGLPLLVHVTEPHLLTATPETRERGQGAHLAIGPRNPEGEAEGWAQALKGQHPQLRTTVLDVDPERNSKADIRIPGRQYRNDIEWARQTAEQAAKDWSAVLLEGGAPILGRLHGKQLKKEVEFYRRRHIKVGIVFSGEEIVGSNSEAAPLPWSRLGQMPPADAARELAHGRLLFEVANAEGITVFYTRPDLARAAQGHWLPYALAQDSFSEGSRILQLTSPAVLHIEDPQEKRVPLSVVRSLRDLHEQGKVRLSIEKSGTIVDRALLERFDIVIDDFNSGSYSLLGCKAMAAGTLAVGYLCSDLKGHGTVDSPILSTEPQCLFYSLSQVLIDPAHAYETAKSGRSFARRWHDGSESASVLSRWILEQRASNGGTADE